MQEKIIITNSRRASMMDCARKHWFRYEQELVPINRNDAFFQGSLTHECLEPWHRNQSTDEIGRILQETRAAFSDDPKAKHIIAHVRATMLAYIKRYPSEQFEPEFLERSFVGDIVNPRTNASSKKLCYAGKVDGVVQQREDGTYWLLEHKTTSDITANYLDKLWEDPQIHLYAHYIEIQEKITITGIIYNILVKSRITQREGETEDAYQARYAEACATSKTGKSVAKRKMPETDEEFAARLSEAYNRPEMFQRQEIILDRTQVREQLEELWAFGQYYLQTRRGKVWFRNRQACRRYNSRCGYFPVCSARPEEFDQMAEMYLKHEAANQELGGDNNNGAPNGDFGSFDF
jgi:hypothetical protein